MNINILNLGSVSMDYGSLLYRTIYIIPLLLVLVSFFPNIRTWLRLVLIVIAFVFFYPFYGIPFVACSPLNNYLGVSIGGGIMGEHKLYKNVITSNIKEIQSRCIPVGWKYYKSTFDKNMPVITTSSLTQKDDFQEVVKPDDSICDIQLRLPTGYRYQDPINSYYGFDVGYEPVCKVILGPHYKSSYEGFDGEMIQLNASQLETPVASSIVKRIYGQDSYGGKDEILYVSKGKRRYRFTWRNQPNTIEDIVQGIASQLQ